MAIETEGGTYINVNGNEEKGHVNIYDSDPRGEHNSIHININYDEDIMQLWYLKQYINNPNELKEYVLIAGNKYPDNTLKLVIKLNGKMKKTLNAIKPKLEYFLSYIETNPLSTKNNVNLSIPRINYCTDNAAMIGVAAYYEYKKGVRHGWDLNAVPNLKLGER